jgi:hypothetical protein
MTGELLAYCSREDVASAVDVLSPAQAYREIDRIIESNSRLIDSECNRVFYPRVRTVYKDFPNRSYAHAWRIWLEADEIISVTSITAGGTAVSSYNLEPINLGPPYDRIEIDLSSTSAWQSGDTFQRSAEIVGLFGYDNNFYAAGTLASAVSSASATTVTVSDGSLAGVGDLLYVDTERLSVSDRDWADTSATLAGSGLTANMADVSATLSSAAVNVGEVLLIDSERVRVTDVTGSVATLTRAVDGSVLAAHASGATVYASRLLTVARAVAGTTAATHLSGATLTRQRYPGPVRTAAIAYSIDQLQQERCAYVRTVGSGDGVRPASGAGLARVRKNLRAACGRQLRYGGV